MRGGETKIFKMGGKLGQGVCVLKRWGGGGGGAGIPLRTMTNGYRNYDISISQNIGS